MGTAMKVYDVVEEVVGAYDSWTNPIGLYKKKKDAFDKAHRLTAENMQTNQYQEISYYVVKRKLR